MCHCAANQNGGFTLIEFVVVIVILGVVSTYAIVKIPSPADATLPSQARKLASDLRHAQNLAITWGESLVVSASGSSYSVACRTAAATAPCNTSPVVDPATGSSFRISLLKGVSFVTPTTASLTFDTLGRPVDSLGVPLTADPSASYTLSSGRGTQTVTVARLSGRVSP